MKAFILAAGFGKRMGALTATRPKPLLALQGIPLLAYTLFRLHQWDITEAGINVHYCSKQIESYIQSFPFFPLRIFREKQILGTAGGLRAAQDFLCTEEFFVLLNPDTILQPHKHDHPHLGTEAMTADETIKSCLYMTHRQPDSLETGWEYVTNKNAYLHHNPVGNRLYIGYALVRSSFLKEFSDISKFSKSGPEEIGPYWKQAAAVGNLIGRDFKGRSLDVGRYEAFENAQKSALIADAEKDKWSRFLSAWPEIKPTDTSGLS